MQGFPDEDGLVSVEVLLEKCISELHQPSVAMTFDIIGTRSSKGLAVEAVKT